MVNIVWGPNGIQNTVLGLALHGMKTYHEKNKTGSMFSILNANTNVLYLL